MNVHFIVSDDKNITEERRIGKGVVGPPSRDGWSPHKGKGVANGKGAIGRAGFKPREGVIGRYAVFCINKWVHGPNSAYGMIVTMSRQVTQIDGCVHHWNHSFPKVF
jgi:hypothetical protein